MKKIITIVLALVLVITLAACSGKKADVLSIGATPVPQAELLNLIKDDLKAAGVNLKIVEFTDYVQPNMAVMAGDLDANFFQHIPYLGSNIDWLENLIPAFGVHIEPFGLYSQKFKSIDDLPEGASIAIPNDPSNGGRALFLLEANGLITLKEDTGFLATVRDITSNPKNLKFQELEAALLPRSLQDVDAAAINGNYALESGFNPINDSLIIEDGNSPYVNIVVVKKGNEEDAKILALRDALLSNKVRDYIFSNYGGGVVPVF